MEVALVVVIDGFYFGQALLGVPCWCYKSPLFHEVLQSTLNSLAVHNSFTFHSTLPSTITTSSSRMTYPGIRLLIAVCSKETMKMQFFGMIFRMFNL